MCSYFISFPLYQDHKTVVKAIYTGEDFMETAVAGSDIGIILESTSFYAEQGGQVQSRSFPETLQICFLCKFIHSECTVCYNLLF